MAKIYAIEAVHTNCDTRSYAFIYRNGQVNIYNMISDNRVDRVTAMIDSMPRKNSTLHTEAVRISGYNPANNK